MSASVVRDADRSAPVDDVEEREREDRRETGPPTNCGRHDQDARRTAARNRGVQPRGAGGRGSPSGTGGNPRGGGIGGAGCPVGAHRRRSGQGRPEPRQRALAPEQLHRLEQRRADPAPGDRHPDRPEGVARLEPEPSTSVSRRAASIAAVDHSGSAASASYDAWTTSRPGLVDLVGALEVRPRRRTGSRASARPRSACSSARPPAASPARAAGRRRRGPGRRRRRRP